MESVRNHANNWHVWAERLSNRSWAYVLILLTGMLMFLPNLGRHGLWDIDEAHNAECAREMYEAGNLIVPTFNYQLRTDKPIMLYWCIEACYRFFGVSEWAARLPSVLAGLCSLIVCYEMARRLFGSATGLLSGLILSSSFMFSVSSHAVTPDALLILFVQLTFLTWVISYDRQQPVWLLLTGCCAGLATLTKGPVGLALPGLAVVLTLLWQRDLSFLWKRRTIQAFLMCCLVALPWYIWVAVETHGEFLKGFFLIHNLSRFNAAMEGHTGPIIYHFVVILVAFAPWSIFLGPTLWFTFSKRSENSEKLWGQRLLLCWIGVWFVVFSVAATKLPNYVLPTYPPLAMLTGAFLVRWWKLSTNESGWQMPGWVWKVCLVWFVFIGIAMMIAVPLITGWISLAPLDGRTLPQAAWFLPLSLVPLVFGWLCWKNWSKNQVGWGVATFVIGSLILTASIGAWAPVAADQERASKPLAQMIQQYMDKADIRIGTHPKFYRPSVVFYLQHEIVRCNTEAQVLEILKTRIPTFMLVPAKEWPSLSGQLAGQLTVLDRRHDFTAGQEILLISNQGTQKVGIVEQSPQ